MEKKMLPSHPYCSYRGVFFSPIVHCYSRHFYLCVNVFKKTHTHKHNKHMTNEIEFNTLTSNKQEMKREEKTFFFHLLYGKFIYTDIVNSIRIKNYKNRVFRYSFLLFVCLFVCPFRFDHEN